MKSRLLFLGSLGIFSLAVACALPGCGKSAIGGGCDTEGSLDECVDGVCGKAQGDTLECLKPCIRQEDCLDGETCAAVANTTEHGCHPTPGATGSD